MKTKIICRRIIPAVLLSALAASAILFAVRSDYRFAAKQAISEMSKTAELKEISSDNLTLRTLKISDLDDSVINQSLILVNTEKILPEDFSPKICEYKSSGVLMNECMTESFSELSKAVKDEFSENLYVMSSYRTAEEQTEIESEQGNDTAMPAGSSEHQTGLALDVYVENFAGEAFIKTETGQFVNENCWKYGFIIRYPLFKRGVTGIDYEPWHLRYVGEPHAELVTKGYDTLEEYYEHLEYGKFYSYKNFIISRQKGEVFLLPECESYVISSDNCGGYIVTSKIS